MGEGFSKENGSWVPYYKGSVDGYISVIASGYEAYKTKVSYDGKYEQKLDITLQDLIHLASCLIMLKMDSKTMILKRNVSSNG